MVQWLLGLPGWRTNGDFMKLQLNSSGWSAGLEQLGWKVHTVDPTLNAEGPAPKEIVNMIDNERIYQWYYIKDDPNYPDGKRADKVRQSLMKLLDIWANPPSHVVADGGFSGIVGFSQGAAMAFLAAAAIEIKLFEDRSYPPIDRVIVVGSPSVHPSYVNVNSENDDGGGEWKEFNKMVQFFHENKTIQTPSLHCIGTKDFLYAMSLENLKFWHLPVKCVVDNYHRFPPFKLVSDEVSLFLEDL